MFEIYWRDLPDDIRKKFSLTMHIVNVEKIKSILGESNGQVLIKGNRILYQFDSNTHYLFFLLKHR